MTRRLAGWILGCLAAVAGLAADPAQATDRIRVLLAQDAGQAEILSEKELAIRVDGGPQQVVGASLTVTPTLDGKLLVNGVSCSSLDVAAAGPGENLTVSLGGMPERARPWVVGGALRVTPAPIRGLTLINQVSLEDYVMGVVPAEMNAGWHLEALKVQAVVARTYALHQLRMNPERDYDVAAGTMDQVYRGRTGVDQRVREAVDATRGLTLTHQGLPILAAFSSTAAGPTEDAVNVWSQDLPYLKGVDCPFDGNSPYYQWRAEFRLQDLEDKLARQGQPVGAIATLTPSAYSKAGRVARIRVLHSRGELMLRGEDLRRLIGYTVIPSTQFEIESIGRTVVLSGRGAGHAVGLCQWGAKEMAGLGYPFETILRYYFPGTQLQAVSMAGGPASRP